MSGGAESGFNKLRASLKMANFRRLSMASDDDQKAGMFNRRSSIASKKSKDLATPKSVRKPVQQTRENREKMIKRSYTGAAVEVAKS